MRLTDTMWEGCILDAPMPQRASKESESHPHLGLANEATMVLRRLVQAMADVAAALPQPVKKSTDLRRQLNIDEALAWKLFRLSHTTNPLEGAVFVPGAGSFRRVMQLAETAGVKPHLTREVLEAFENYEELAARHAPDRSAFAALLRELHGADSNTEDLKNKRAAYRANRQLFGVHTEVTLRSTFFHPAASGEGFDMAKILGHVRIQRSRLNSTLLSETRMSFGPPGTWAQHVPGQLLDTSNRQPGELTLLEEFCSKPIPELRSLVSSKGSVTTQIHATGLGSAQAATYFFAGSSRNIRTVRPHSGKTLQSQSLVGLPAELLVRDVWLHKSIWSKIQPVVEVLWREGGGSFIVEDDNRQTDLLPMKETVIERGTGAKAGQLAEFNRYPDMVTAVAEQMEWNLNDFHLFRCRIEYPLLHSLVIVIFPLSDPGTS